MNLKIRQIENINNETKKILTVVSRGWRKKRMGRFFGFDLS